MRLMFGDASVPWHPWLPLMLSRTFHGLSYFYTQVSACLHWGCTWQQLRHWLIPGFLHLPWDQSYEPQEWRIEPQGIPGSLSRGKASRPGSPPEQRWGHLEPVKVRRTAKGFQGVLCVCWVVSNSFETPWTAAHQAPLCMGFSRQESWSGLPCPPPGDPSNPGIEPSSPASRTWILYHWAVKDNP